MNKYIILFLFLTSNLYSQYQEAAITRTTSTNSVFPRQFPSMTIRKMNQNEYWIFESLGTNTIFHRQFPTYIVRKDNYGKDHPNQKWGVYRTTTTNSVFPRQFPDRYISSLEPDTIENNNASTRISKSQNLFIQNKDSQQNIQNSYTYSKTLRQDAKPSYNAESPE